MTEGEGGKKEVKREGKVSPLTVEPYYAPSHAVQ